MNILELQIQTADNNITLQEWSMAGKYLVDL